MNRKLLVTLLNKNIEELNMITDGFMEMENYPAAIILLAKRKTEDIQLIIEELAQIKPLVNSIKQIDTTEETVIKPEINVEVAKTFTLDELSASDAIISTPTKSSTENNIVEASIDFKEEATEILSFTESKDETAISIETTEIKEHTEVFENHQIKITTDESKKTTIADKIVPTILSRNEILSKNDNSLSATLANKKITDIKQAISIGDRFRFQRELFKGNGEEMNKTLTYINQLATLNEVFAFLKSKYGWDENNETAEDFRQIIKRKFL